MKKPLLSLGLALLAFAPFTAFAAANVSLVDVTYSLFSILLRLIPVFTALALLGFLWGLMRFIWNAGDEKKREEGRNVMIWGILAFFVFLSIVGITNVLQSTFGVGGDQTLKPPSASPSSYGF